MLKKIEALCGGWTDAGIGTLNVTRAFRKGSAIPREIGLHLAALDAGEMEMVETVAATIVRRKISDVRREKSLPESLLREAFEDARRPGKLTGGRIAEGVKHPAVAQAIEQRLKRISRGEAMGLQRRRRRVAFARLRARIFRRGQTGWDLKGG